jgi:hypothetical protein
MNSTLLSYKSDKFKGCDGRGCNQKPIKYLRIKYIKKIALRNDRKEL